MHKMEIEGKIPNIYIFHKKPMTTIFASLKSNENSTLFFNVLSYFYYSLIIFQINKF